jgi:hypothetical protein
MPTMHKACGSFRSGTIRDGALGHQGNGCQSGPPSLYLCCLDRRAPTSKSEQVGAEDPREAATALPCGESSCPDPRCFGSSIRLLICRSPRLRSAGERGRRREKVNQITFGHMMGIVSCVARPGNSFPTRHQGRSGQPLRVRPPHQAASHWSLGTSDPHSPARASEGVGLQMRLLLNFQSGRYAFLKYCQIQYLNVLSMLERSAHAVVELCEASIRRLSCYP